MAWILTEEYQSTQRETYCNAILPTTNSTLISLVFSLGLEGERLESNHLMRHTAAQMRWGRFSCTVCKHMEGDSRDMFVATVPAQQSHGQSCICPYSLCDPPASYPTSTNIFSLR